MRRCGCSGRCAGSTSLICPMPRRAAASSARSRSRIRTCPRRCARTRCPPCCRPGRRYSALPTTPASCMSAGRWPGSGLGSPRCISPRSWPAPRARAPEARAPGARAPGARAPGARAPGARALGGRAHERAGEHMSMPTYLGMPAFPEAAATALQDSQLRRNLAHATGAIRVKRAAAVAELSDWAELRAAAKAIKDHTLANLDIYLTRLEERVVSAGGQVHWAADAAEANDIVISLVRAAGADQVVKVKSMVTQETGLNEALAAEHIHALETDLAELIIQLDGDRPSHILVPAIHRNRAEIRDIFLRDIDRK